MDGAAHPLIRFAVGHPLMKCPSEAHDMNWKDVKAEFMRDPAFVREYEALELGHQVTRAIIEMLRKRDLSQEELAVLVETKPFVV